MFREPKPETAEATVGQALARQLEAIERLMKSKASRWLGMAILALGSEGCYGMYQEANLAWARSLQNACEAGVNAIADPRNAAACDQAKKVEKEYQDEREWQADLPKFKNWKQVDEKEQQRLIKRWGPKAYYAIKLYES